MKTIEALFAGFIFGIMLRPYIEVFITICKNAYDDKKEIKK